MGEPTPATSPARRRPALEALGFALGLVASYTLVPMLGATIGRWIDGWLLEAAVHPPATGWLSDPELVNALQRVFDATYWVVVPTYVLAVGLATLGGPLVLLARMLARWRVRAGDADPLDRVRAWQRRNRRWIAPLLAAPGLGWSAVLAYSARHVHIDPTFAFLYLLPVLGLAVLGHFGLRALTAPTTHADTNAPPPAIADDEIVFSALAVTRETRGALGVAVAAMLAAIVFVTVPGVPLLALVPAIIAAVYHRASRIAVGIDGVLVRGTTGARFFSYATLDGARVRRGDLELLRGGRVVLRLQLHGEDAARREAILARIEAKIAQAAARRDHATDGYVASATPEQITRSVAGAVDFRQPAVSREALWEIVEGPSMDAEVRAAAAKALAQAIDAPERARLRVAAAQCAEPRVRVALEKIEEELAQTEDAAPARRALVRTI